MVVCRHVWWNVIYSSSPKGLLTIGVFFDMNEGITRKNMKVYRGETEMRNGDGREIKGGVEERNKARIVDAGVRRTALESPDE